MANNVNKLNKRKKILKMKDPTDKSVIKRNDGLFDVPFRIGFVGGSGTGKTNLLTNLILDPLKEFYRDVWLPENIYLFSGSYKTDTKMQLLVKCLGIESSNIFLDYDDDVVNTIYDDIEERLIEYSAQNSRSVFVDLIF